MRDPSELNLDQSMPSRRDVLRALVAGVASTALYGCADDEPTRNQGEATPSDFAGVDDPLCDTGHPNKIDDFTEVPSSFSNSSAEKVAENLSIDPGSYFVLNPGAIKEVNASGNFRKLDWIAPIFPPAVMKHEDSIIAAATEFGVPASIMATLATIESAGNTKASSGANAHGIVQVVPKYHQDRIDELSGQSFGSDAERSMYLQENPDQCLRIGASYYAECVETARREKPFLNPDSMVIFARAAAAYNGGPANAGRQFEDLPLESKLYVNHVARLTLDIEIASHLEAAGADTDEILRAMQSAEINARAKAYDGFKRGSKDFALYEKSAALCATPVPGVDIESGEIVDQQIYDDYRNYLRTCGDEPFYTAPAVPGLRIWLAGGGDSLFLAVPENAAWKLP